MSKRIFGLTSPLPVQDSSEYTNGKAANGADLMKSRLLWFMTRTPGTYFSDFQENPLFEQEIQKKPFYCEHTGHKYDGLEHTG